MKEYSATVTENKKIAENIYSMTLALPEEVKIGGGQFLNVSTGNGKNLLKRPFGVMKTEGKCVTFCYQIKGGGTEELARVKVDDVLDVLLPLGNGFVIPETAQNIVVLGGGVGIFPLISVIREHKDKRFFSYIGFRNKACACLLGELNKSRKLTIVTDDGSLGEKGNAVSAYFDDKDKPKADLIIACGPPIMLKVLKERLKAEGVTTPCLVSLEERMGCGIGACLVCVCKKSDGQNARVCKDGPVFDINEVEL